MRAVGQCNGRRKFCATYSSKLRDLRTSMLQALVHDTAPPLDTDASRWLHTDCEDAGFCVHGADGRDIIACRSQLLRLLVTRRFPGSHKAQRAVLSTGRVVMLAIGDVVPSGPAGPDGVPPPVVMHNIWIHLGAVDLRPREFEAHVLCVRGSDAESNLVAADTPCGEISSQGAFV